MKKHEVLWVCGLIAMLVSACCADSEGNGWIWMFAAGAAAVFAGFAARRIKEGKDDVI